MTNNDKTVRHNMVRRVETKEDGRNLIYYTFESSEDLLEKQSRSDDAAQQVASDEPAE